MLGAAQVDALLEIDRAVVRRAEGRIARCDALHADRCVAMAVGAAAAGGAGLLVPQHLAVEHPQRRRIGGVVVLHGLAVAAEIGIAGAALVERNVGRAGGSRGRKQLQRHHCNRDHVAARGMRRWWQPVHSTVMVATAVSEKPLSPVHLNSSVPLSVATVKKVTNGLAAMAGERSARKTSTPL